MRFSYYYGMRLGDWLRLLAAARFRVSPKCVHRACAYTLTSTVNSIFGFLENIRYSSIIEAVEIESPPIFILGHPRSGTTHLHNILALDSEFAAPTLPQVFFPHSFLLTERLVVRMLGSRFPRIREYDNMILDLKNPQEEELALCSLGAASPYQSLLLPGAAENYSKFLRLRELPEDEIQRWIDIYSRYLKKLTYRYNRRLVLKSSPSTARIETLLELFPEARFVHISRHPFDLFKSYRAFILYLHRNFAYLQEPDLEKLDDSILQYYNHMYDMFFAGLPLLAGNRFHNLKFEDLEKDPLQEIGLLYEALELPGFWKVRPEIERYMKRISGYRKNEYPVLTEKEKERISRNWKRSFDHWHYTY
ncbi:MAG: sulfotransferase [Candidatus Fermentibacteria bacterium]